MNTPSRTILVYRYATASRRSSSPAQLRPAVRSDRLDHQTGINETLCCTSSRNKDSARYRCCRTHWWQQRSLGDGRTAGQISSCVNIKLYQQFQLLGFAENDKNRPILTPRLRYYWLYCVCRSAERIGYRCFTFNNERLQVKMVRSVYSCLWQTDGVKGIYYSIQPLKRHTTPLWYVTTLQG